MNNPLLTDLISWARSAIDKPIMLNYRLQKINSQIPGSLFLLLKQPDSQRPNAEIEITVDSKWSQVYQVSFSFLPFTVNMPRPDFPQISFQNLPELIQWLQTGRRPG